MSMLPLLGVAAPEMSPGRTALLSALADTLGVAVESRPFGCEAGIAGWIVLDATRETIEQVRSSSLPCFVAVAPRACVDVGATETLEFVRHAAVPQVLRGRTIRAGDVADAKGLPHWLQHLSQLATKNGTCVWTADDRSGRHRYTALTPPDLDAKGPLFNQFSSARLAQLLPLVSFLLEFRSAAGWEPPPLQASFMIDDPNLHWPTYGHLDFRVLGQRARRRRYHVAIATIPLDSWYMHDTARLLFEQHSAELSLLLHGNDHVSNELARPRSAASTDRLLAQALRRISRLERRSRITISHVMAPPHGACSEETIAGMARMGFEGVCVSRGSLRHHNAGASWLTTLGMKPCDYIAGLTVIPRFGLTPRSTNDILLAAVLRQPIVPMTHHQALADGYGILDDTADFINSLGDVTWRDTGSIARALFHWRRNRGDIEVHMLSTRVTVEVPEQTRLHVCGPAGAEAPVWWRPCHTTEPWHLYRADEGLLVPSRVALDITSSPSVVAPVVPPAMPFIGNPKPLGRRLLTEVRDRSRPLVRRVFAPVWTKAPGQS